MCRSAISFAGAKGNRFYQVNSFQTRAYRRNGVKEYVVWQVLDQTISWFYLEKGEYLDLPIDTDGIIRSRVFPGLWLAVAQLLAGNMQGVLAVLQEGVQSPEHTAFAQKLASYSATQIH